MVGGGGGVGESQARVPILCSFLPISFWKQMAKIKG